VSGSFMGLARESFVLRGGFCYSESVNLFSKLSSSSRPDVHGDIGK